MKKDKRIRRRGQLWMNKKKSQQLYRGSYRFVKGEREFILVNPYRLKDKVMPFNSHEAAKDAGWRVAAK